jgi:hypothetical protein
MKHRRSLFIGTILAVVLFTSLACLSSEGGGINSPLPSTPTSPSTSTIRQWASNASASSEFGSSDWAAQQVVGAPDTSTCGDSPTAWASMENNGVDWLDVGFAAPVVPTQINIYESYTPGSIVKVEVRDTEGSFHTVWEGTPASAAECPRLFVINLSDIDFKVTALLISVDQSVLGNWDEIDAVELVGTP